VEEEPLTRSQILDLATVAFRQLDLSKAGEAVPR
jgi:hypothetical protein